MRKERALCVLLLLGADCSIKNDEGLDPRDICLSILDKDIQEYRFDAYKLIIPYMKPEDFRYFDGEPGSFEMRSAAKEAAKASQAGRQ